MLISPSLRALRKIMRTAEQGERKLAQATGLTASQVLVLEEVDRGGDVMPSEVALALQLSQASITNIVDRLVELELVVRRKGERDKRQVRLTLTERGLQMLQTAPDLLQNRFARRFQTLPAWEQAMMLAGLERLADLLDEGGTETEPTMHSGAIHRNAA
jgi:DNA-binding MarR family transcriptional regulator